MAILAAKKPATANSPIAIIRFIICLLLVKCLCLHSLKRRIGGIRAKDFYDYGSDVELARVASADSRWTVVKLQ